MTRRPVGRSSTTTRSTVLDLIRTGGEVTRVDLADRSGLTEMTISKVVRELLKDGVVEEAGQARSTGGKPPVLLRLSAAQRFAVGVALDAKAVLVVLCTLTGVVVRRRELPGTDGREPSSVLDDVVRAVQVVLTESGVSLSSLVGVGVANGGRKGQRSWDADAVVSDRWERFPVAEELSERLDGALVTVSNDANCAALGHFWASRDTDRDFALVYVSYGIGVAIVINGDVYRGASGNAGEIGHVVAEPGGDPCWCGARGCLETVGPPRGVVRQVRADAALAASLDVRGGETDEAVYGRFAASVRAGDDPSLALLRRSTAATARTLLGLVNVLDVAHLVLTGPGLAELGTHVLAEVRATLEASSVVSGVHPVSVELGGVTADTAAVGAAAVVLHGTLTPHHVAGRT